jgi:hypothetical protein
MKTAPPARPPRARIPMRAVSVAHHHQARRGVARRPCPFACPTVAPGVAVRAAAIARAACSTRPPRALQGQSTWPKIMTPADASAGVIGPSIERRFHGGLHRPARFSPSYTTSPAGSGGLGSPDGMFW